MAWQDSLIKRYNGVIVNCSDTWTVWLLSQQSEKQTLRFDVLRMGIRIIVRINELLAYKKTIVLVLILVLIAIFLVFFKASPKKRQNANPGLFVQTTILKAAQHQPMVPLIATANPRNNTSITAFVHSKVLSVNFSAGDFVKKGTLLVLLDGHIYQSELEKNKAIVKRFTIEKAINKKQCASFKQLYAHAKKLYMLSQADYQRNASLFKKRFVSQATLEAVDQKQINAQHTMQEREFALTSCELKNDTLSAQLNEAKSRERQSEKNVQETKVYAPYDGIVTQKNVSEGRTVTVGQTMLVMYDPKSVELEALIPEAVYSVISHRNDHLKACHYSKKKKLCFELSRIGQNVSALGVGHMGYFKPMQSVFVRSGVTLRLYLNMPAKKTFLIPASALYQTKYIFLIQKNRLKRERVVKIGYGDVSETDGQPQVLIAYKQSLAGERILASFMPDARTGVLVRFNQKESDEKK